MSDWGDDIDVIGPDLDPSVTWVTGIFGGARKNFFSALCDWIEMLQKEQEP